WYDGDLVIIRTASGNDLACTPNHPILTDRGWVAAHLLDKGGNVICQRFGQRVAADLDVQNQNMPTRIEDIAETFAAAEKGRAGPVPVAAEDFHGDGVGSDVAIVWSDSMLLNDSDPAVDQHAGEQIVRLARMIGETHIGAGSLHALIKTAETTAGGDMSGS